MTFSYGNSCPKVRREALTRVDTRLFHESRKTSLEFWTHFLLTGEGGSRCVELWPPGCLKSMREPPYGQCMSKLEAKRKDEMSSKEENNETSVELTKISPSNHFLSSNLAFMF